MSSSYDSNFDKKIKNPELRKLAKDIFDTVAGHDHDGVNTKSVTVGAVGAGSITNNMLAADVKAGSLAALTTTAKGSLQAAINELDGEHGILANLTTDAKNTLIAAINEVDGHADAAYTKPGGGIPAADLAAAVQTSLGKADTAMQGGATITSIRAKKIQLNGNAYTPVNFGVDSSATVTGTQAATFNMTGVGDGGTLIFTTEGAAQTATFNFAKGYHTGAAGASTDISGEVDNKFRIAVDTDVAGPSYQEVTLTIAAGLNSGANIAAEIQTRIQALGGIYAAVTCIFSVDHYVITSGTFGTGSKVRIAAGTTNSITEELKIGTDGTNTDGTGDCINAAVVTVAEVKTVVEADCNKLTVDDDGASHCKFTSKVAGRTSKIVVGNGTLDAVIGVTNTNEYYGGQGMGYGSNMSDTNYFVTFGLSSVAPTALNVSHGTKTTTGFPVYCETTADTSYIDVVIFGLAA